MAHDTMTVNPVRGGNKLIANLADHLTADTVGILVNFGFIPAVDGIAAVKPGLGAAVVLVPVVAGVHVPLDISEFSATLSTAGQELVVIRQGVG